MATRQTTMPTRLETRKPWDNAAWRTIAILTVLSSSLLGCRPGGPPIAPVSGVVRLDGKPLAEGRGSARRGNVSLLLRTPT